MEWWGTGSYPSIKGDEFFGWQINYMVALQVVVVWV